MPSVRFTALDEPVSTTVLIRMKMISPSVTLAVPGMIAVKPAEIDLRPLEEREVDRVGLGDVDAVLEREIREDDAQADLEAAAFPAR